MNTLFCKPIIILANSHEVRSQTGAFSAALNDASAAAYKASRKAHQAGTPEAHAKASKLHNYAADKATAENQPSHATMHKGIADSHVAMAVSLTPAAPELADDRQDACPTLPNGTIELALANEAGLDADGWCLIAPFGEWPNTRIYQENGQVKEQIYIQVLNNESVDKMVSAFNSVGGRIKRFVSAVPIYRGHGDLKELDPKVLGNVSKVKIGSVDQLRRGARGMEAHLALDSDGHSALEAGCKYPSGLWAVLPNAESREQKAEMGAIRCTPFKLISVALTTHPNISGVESLANDRSRTSTWSPTIPCEEKPTNTEPNMKLIAGWLLANGMTLANAEAPTETQVLEALQRLHTSKSADVATLGNEKQTLSGTITALTTERDAFKRKTEELTPLLANEQTARAGERKGRAEAVVDLAIHKGKLTVAQRDDRVAWLANSADFAAAAQTLLEGVTVVKVVGTDAMSGKQGATLANEQALTQEYNTALQTELVAAGQDPVKAHQNILTLPKYSGLAEKLMPKKA